MKDKREDYQIVLWCVTYCICAVVCVA